MDVNELGEFGLIDHLTRDFPLVQPSSLKGVGDDAAVIDYGGPQCAVVATDMLVEGIHFDLATRRSSTSATSPSWSTCPTSTR
jgi:thiamine-monophosphate kinase